MMPPQASHASWRKDCSAMWRGSLQTIQIVALHRAGNFGHVCGEESGGIVKLAWSCVGASSIQVSGSLENPGQFNVK